MQWSPIKVAWCDGHPFKPLRLRINVMIMLVVLWLYPTLHFPRGCLCHLINVMRSLKNRSLKPNMRRSWRLTDITRGISKPLLIGVARFSWSARHRKSPKSGLRRWYRCGIILPCRHCERSKEKRKVRTSVLWGRFILVPSSQSSTCNARAWLSIEPINRRGEWHAAFNQLPRSSAFQLVWFVCYCGNVGLLATAAYLNCCMIALYAHSRVAFTRVFWHLASRLIGACFS